MTRHLPKVIASFLVLFAAGHAIRGQQPAGDTERGGAAATGLAPTVHPPLPDHPSRYWLLPERTAAASSSSARTEDPVARLSRAVRLIGEGQHAAALPLIEAARLAPAPVADYAQYYRASALAALSRFDEADLLLTTLHSRKPEGYLRQAVALQLATVALARSDAPRSLAVLESVASAPIAPEGIALRIGEAAEAAGNIPRALEAYRTVYYDHPLAGEAAKAQTAIERLETPSLIPADRFTRSLARAERLFAARRWAQARPAFEHLARAATSADDRELLALRLAEADYYLDRHRAARDALRPYLDEGSRRAEARFFHLTATLALGDRATYLRLARRLVDEFPDSSWAEETLNNLASHYIIEDDDEAADRVFRELTQKFPRSRYGERAAWKIGWLAYKKRQFADAAVAFEAASAAYPRADRRPAWLYWSGRARDRSGDRATANARYRLAVTDYQNSYYGRLATRILTERKEPAVSPSVGPKDGAPTLPGFPTGTLIRQLVAAEMYTDALNELQYAQRVWGDSPALQATVAWIRHELGLEQESMERFQNIRGAITLMKRAYPQFLAAGGEQLPPEVLRVMFPLDYWALIRKYSAQYKLDPYLMASLVAQESTFTADVRSAANAYGLMQLLPSAGRQYARKVGLRYSLSLLSNPDANLRMGMAYFSDLSNRFGGDHFALAGYNAGPHRVVRWIAERPGLAIDEFIDDIPFPETQNYVKRILGQAEDYRRLYGGGVLSPRR